MGYLRRRGRGRRFGRKVGGKSFFAVLGVGLVGRGWDLVASAVCVGGDGRGRGDGEAEG